MLHAVVADSSIVGYLLLSPDGIPVRHHDSIAYADAVLYASLVGDFHTRARLSMIELLGNQPDAQLSDFRMRTDKGTELIVTVADDYLLVLIQKCGHSESNSN